MRLIWVWFLQIVKAPISSRRFVVLTPFFIRKQVVYDKQKNAVLRLEIEHRTDWETILQVFKDEEYCLSSLARSEQITTHYESILESGLVPLIIDCGGNIGAASVYLQHEFPETRVWLVEPDHRNIELAKKNVSMAKFYEAAIGNASGSCMIGNPKANPNAFRASFELPGPVPVITMLSLLTEVKIEGFCPFILKVDIEGAESELFHDSSWLSKFPILLIEFHDWMLPGKGSSRTALKALSEDDRDFVLNVHTAISISNHLIK